jgi:hypothetical protein
LTLEDVRQGPKVVVKAIRREQHHTPRRRWTSQIDLPPRHAALAGRLGVARNTARRRPATEPTPPNGFPTRSLFIGHRRPGTLMSAALQGR